MVKSALALLRGNGPLSGCSLGHELQLKILKSVSYVDAAEFVAVNLVVEVEAGPEEAAAECDLVKDRHLEVPAALGLILRQVLEEAVIEGDTRSLKLLSLGLIENVTEVAVLSQLERILRLKTTERFVAAHLVLRRHLVGADGSHLAVVLDSVNHVVDAVNLSEGLDGHLNLLLFADVTLELSTIFLILIFSDWLRLFRSLFAFLELDVLGGLAEEVIVSEVNEVAVLVVQVRHGLERIVTGEAPEELLDGELKLILEDETAGNVVVSLDTCKQK